MSDRITLVDVDNWSKEAFFGTCSFCGYEGIAVYQDLIFKDRNNIEFKVSLDEWEYGEFYQWEHLEASEVCEFAEFIYKKNIETRKELNNKISDLIIEFKEIKEC